MAARMSPARRAFWKRYQPASCRDALEQCKNHGREALNLSVERIAEQMGLADHWALYKWIQNGRFPLVLAPAYERVCGIDLITRWLAATRRHLLVPMPVGRAASSADLVGMSTAFQHAVQLLSNFYQGAGQGDPQSVLDALRAHMQDVAYHHANVAGFKEPQLEFQE